MTILQICYPYQKTSVIQITSDCNWFCLGAETSLSERKRRSYQNASLIFSLGELWTVNNAPMIWYFKMKNDIKVHWKLSVYVEPHMSFGNVYCVHVQNKVIPKSASEKRPVYKTELLVFCLLVCGLTSSSRIFFSWRRGYFAQTETLSLTVKGCRLKAPWPFCTERLLPCHTCCDTGSLFLKSPPKD